MFKDQLRQIKAERGLNSRELAELLGVSPASVCGYISGKVTPPGKKKRELALALGLDAEYFGTAAGDVSKAIQSDGGYRLSAENAARLMGIGRDDLLNLLEDGVYTFGRVWKKRGAFKRTCWISRILFTQETGIPVPIEWEAVT